MTPLLAECADRTPRGTAGPGGEPRFAGDVIWTGHPPGVSFRNLASLMLAGVPRYQLCAAYPGLTAGDLADVKRWAVTKMQATTEAKQ